MPTSKTRKKSARSRASARSSKTSRPIKRQAKPSPPGRPGRVNEWMELRGSGIHGLGAFAIRDIPRGTRIIEYAGERINNAEADRRYDEEGPGDHHTFLFILSSRTCVDAAFDGNEARFINHSCAPNCETSVWNSRIWISALGRIPAGTELTYDYLYDDDPEYTEEDLRYYRCDCGAPTCRKTMVDTKRLMR
jgi:SET domain-containing protein